MLKLAIFSLCALVMAADDPHNINDCVNPGPSPTTAYNQIISKGPKLGYQDDTIRIPANGFIPGPITCIVVTNQDSDTDGGYPKEVDGGVGYTYVDLNFRSQWCKGYSFKVQIYY